VPEGRCNDLTLGNAGVLLGALWALRYDVPGAADLAAQAVDILLAEQQETPAGLMWPFIPERYVLEPRRQMPNWSHGLAGIAGTLAGQTQTTVTAPLRVHGTLSVPGSAGTPVTGRRGWVRTERPLSSTARCCATSISLEISSGRICSSVCPMSATSRVTCRQPSTRRLERSPCIERRARLNGSVRP